MIDIVLGSLKQFQNYGLRIKPFSNQSTVQHYRKKLIITKVILRVAKNRIT